MHLEKVVAGFSGYHKYTLGTELRQGSRAVLQQVVRTNHATDAFGRAAELLRPQQFMRQATANGAAPTIRSNEHHALECSSADRWPFSRHRKMRRPRTARFDKVSQ
jgi:hypothetical protein